MNKAQLSIHTGAMTPSDFNRLPTPQRALAAEQKYAEAVAMYADTSLSIRRIAENCGVTAAGLSAHIAKHHRSLLFERYGLDPADADTLKVKPAKGQTPAAHLKYKQAIEACGDVAYIEYNVAQIARMFSLDGTALAAQLRVHYPDVMPMREKLRQRLGLADNTPRGARQRCEEAYAEAMQMYLDSDMTITEVAAKCGVSKSGFSQFMRYYHKDVIEQKAARRKAAKRSIGARKAGTLSGNGSLYGPKPETVARYAQAVELRGTTPMTLSEIAQTAGVTEAGLQNYLHRWHTDAESTGRGLKSAAAKYAPAIASMKENPRAVAKVAAEFGLNAEVFRAYLKAHEPELAASRSASAERYAQAISEYATTAEPLKSIARRHGIVYNSLSAYVARNCPAERESHRLIVQTAAS